YLWFGCGFNSVRFGAESRVRQFATSMWASAFDCFYRETFRGAGCASLNSISDPLGREICCPPGTTAVAAPAPAPRAPPSAAPPPPPATPPTRAPSPAPRRPRLVVLPD